MNLKEKSIKHWNEKIRSLNPKKGVTDLTKPEMKRKLLKEYQENLSFVKPKPISWFEQFEKLANIQVTSACCGGHNKASINEALRREEEGKLDCGVPTNSLLYSFGEFNGVGSV